MKKELEYEYDDMSDSESDDVSDDESDDDFKREYMWF